MTLPLVGMIRLRASGEPRSRLLGGFALTVVIVFCGAAFNSPHMYGRYWAVPFVLVVALVFLPRGQGATTLARRDVASTRPNEDWKGRGGA
jgi:hypothetical protein